MLRITLSKDTGERGKERGVLTLWRFVSLPDLAQHRLRALFPLVGIALGVAVFIAVRVTNTSTLGAFARTVDAIAGRAGLEITGRGALLDEAVLPQARRVPGVAAVAPLILADVVVPEAGGAVLLVAGIDVVSDRAVRDYTFHWTEGDKQDPFAILTQPQAVVLSERFAQRYGFRLGSACRSTPPRAYSSSWYGAYSVPKGPPKRWEGILRSWILLRLRCCSIGLDA